MPELILTSTTLDDGKVTVNQRLSFWFTGLTGNYSIFEDNNTGNQSNNDYSFVKGYSNIAASAITSIFGGSGNTNISSASNIINGDNNYITENNSFLFGTNSIIFSGNSAILAGSTSYLQGYNSLLVSGTGNTVNANNSVVIGSNDQFLSLNNYVLLNNVLNLGFTTATTVNTNSLLSNFSVIKNINSTNVSFTNLSSSTFNISNIKPLSTVIINSGTSINIDILNSGTSINVSANTFYSGSTPLANLFIIGSNVGNSNNSVNLFRDITGTTLNFKSISASTNILITSSSTVVSINLQPNISITNISATTYYSGHTPLSSLFETGLNLGNNTTQGFFSGLSGSFLTFQSLSGSNIVFDSGNTITVNLSPNININSITATTFILSGINLTNFFKTGTNIGTSFKLYSGNTGTFRNIFNFKTLSGSNTTNITNDTNNITFNTNSFLSLNIVSATTYFIGSSPLVFSANSINLGTGTTVYKDLNGVNFEFKTFIADNPLSITTSASTLNLILSNNLSAKTFSAHTIFSGTNELSKYFRTGNNINVLSINAQGVYNGNSGTFNQLLNFKSVSGGTNIILTTDTFNNIFVNTNSNINLSSVTATNYFSGSTPLMSLIPFSVSIGSGIKIYSGNNSYSKTMNYRSLSGGNNIIGSLDVSTQDIIILDTKPNILVTTFNAGKIFSGSTDIGILFREGANIGIAGSSNFYSGRTNNILKFLNFSGGVNTTATTNNTNHVVSLDLQPNITINSLTSNTTNTNNLFVSNVMETPSLTANSISATTIYNYSGGSEVFNSLQNELYIMESFNNGLYPKTQITDIFLTNQININSGFLAGGTPYPGPGIFALNGQNDSTQNGVYSAGTSLAVKLTGQSSYYINYTEGSIFKVTGSSLNNNTFWIVPHYATISNGPINFNMIQINQKFIDSSIMNSYEGSIIPDPFEISSTADDSTYDFYFVRPITVPNELYGSISTEFIRRFPNITTSELVVYTPTQLNDNQTTIFDNSSNGSSTLFNIQIIDNTGFYTLQQNYSLRPLYQFSIHQKLNYQTINSLITQLLLPGNGNSNNVYVSTNIFPANNPPLIEF